MKLKVLSFSLVLLAAFSLSARADNENGSEPRSPLQGTVESARSAASELVVQAMSLLGINYKYGGQSPDKGFDCSGFVGHVFKEAAGVILPHNAYQMSLVSKKVSAGQLQPGDLVFYNTLKRAFSHVGIYVGDNKFIHAPSKGKSVEIVDMKDTYWAKRFQGGRRVPQLELQTADPSLQSSLQLKQDSSQTEILALLY